MPHTSTRAKEVGSSSVGVGWVGLGLGWVGSHLFPVLLTQHNKLAVLSQ